MDSKFLRLSTLFIIFAVVSAGVVAVVLGTQKPDFTDPTLVENRMVPVKEVFNSFAKDEQTETTISPEVVTSQSDPAWGVPVEGETDTTTVSSFNEIIDYCSMPPRFTDSGREIYPVNKEKYGNLSFLGSIFTAYDCGPERLNKFYRGEDADYDLGSAVWLNKSPSYSLIFTLQEIGYSCGDKELREKECLKWELFDTVKIRELLKLKPFYTSFEIDDCRKCG